MNVPWCVILDVLARFTRGGIYASVVADPPFACSSPCFITNCPSCSHPTSFNINKVSVLVGGVTRGLIGLVQTLYSGLFE